ncbi:hypothetical protein T4C_4432 [Trichinella pseudospiralis]|uniref:Uncharacterized protein n=1 Tax=Trichinella pseudospiralis TaxID=6337 RepID=A0A0V1JVK5_TRIPS|nr:hypothetical protein T4C_4432 [Trichinella pseudospiralis]
MSWASTRVTELILRWSTQNRREPSFFQTSTTGEHQGPKAGSFTLVCIIFQINQFTVSRLDGGRRRGGNLTGCAPPVSMRGWLKFIRLTSAAPHEMTFSIRISEPSVMVNFLACQSISLMYWLRKFIPRITGTTRLFTTATCIRPR